MQLHLKDHEGTKSMEKDALREFVDRAAYAKDAEFKKKIADAKADGTFIACNIMTDASDNAFQNQHF